MTRRSNFPSLFPLLFQVILVFGLLGTLVLANNDNNDSSDDGDNGGKSVRPNTPEAGKEIKKIFDVKTGNILGTCDKHLANLDLWLEDSKQLAKFAIAMIDNTQHQGNPEHGHSQVALWNFFRIGPDDTQDKERVQTNLQSVLDTINDELPFPGGKPRLYCGDEWQQEQSWDDKPKPGRKLGQTHERNSNGETLKEVFKGVYGRYYADSDEDLSTSDEGEEDDEELVPFWCPDLKQYIFETTGRYCRDGIENLGSTTEQVQPHVVTICTGNMKDLPAVSLSELPGVTTGDEWNQAAGKFEGDGVTMEDFHAQSLTLFHELFHLVLGNAETPDIAYEIKEILRAEKCEKTDAKITKTESMENPETYTMFSLAAYLSVVNPDFSFATGRSAWKSGKAKRAKRADTDKFS